MARKDIKSPQKALLISGLIYKKGLDLEEILSDLTSVFGDILKLSESYPFSWTDYYKKEMGADLLRCFISFKGLVEQDTLPSIKHRAMDIEDKWSVSKCRQVNIDPGILTLERLVLATTKNYTHRIYLGSGIYADLTLIFQKGRYKALEWTYPDYKSEFALDFFLEARVVLKQFLKTSLE